MSIEFSPAFDRISRGMGASPMQPAAPAAPRRKRLKPPTHGRGAHATKKPSARRIAANRRNAKRSTGPRTVDGKRRSSRNAIKHGLCSTAVCLDGECAAAYATFVAELEEELQPRTPLQRSLLPHIANLLWRINRLPQAQVELFEQELKKCARNEQVTSAQVLARRFSADPTDNGFLLLGRYERGLHNQLHRLMSRYEWLKKNRATIPVDEHALRVEQDRRTAEVDARIDEDNRRLNAQREAEEREAEAKRTQSNPPQNRDGGSETTKCAETDAPPVTKRTQRVTGTPSPVDPIQSATPAGERQPAIRPDSECS